MLRSVDSTPLEIAVLVLILVVGAPFFEELFFRGLVQGSLTARFGSRRAIWMQALVFALIHYQVGMNLPQFLITFTSIAAVGLVLGVLRWHYERLGPGMVAHALFNAVVVVVIFAT